MSAKVKLLLPLVVLVVAAVVVVLLVTGGDDDGSSSSGGPGPGSATGLKPPKLDVVVNEPGQAPGFVFIAPKVVFGVERTAAQQQGAIIADTKGRVRWFGRSTSLARDVYDLRASTYEGKPVMTYFEGKDEAGIGKGDCVLRDEHYDEVARVRFGGPNGADFHECRLTSRGTMLMTGYETVTGDTSQFPGGKKADEVTEGVVKEVDVATGKVLLTWHSLAAVPLKDTYSDFEGHTGPGFDYFHLNSVSEDTDGNLLVSGRHTWAVYKLDRKTGKVLWTMGGKHPTIKLPGKAEMAWQHDAEAAGDGEIRVFDNGAGEAGGLTTNPYSRVIWLKPDLKAGKATLVRELRHPDDLQTASQGNAEPLPGGNLFVGWGFAAHASEFSPDGKLLWDVTLPESYDSYRSYKEAWTGTPDTKPEATARAMGGGVRVRASWNGSTEVQRWQVLAGDSADGDLKPVGQPFAWNGLWTFGTAPTKARFVAVRALDGQGKELATSKAVPVVAG